VLHDAARLPRPGRVVVGGDDRGLSLPGNGCASLKYLKEQIEAIFAQHHSSGTIPTCDGILRAAGTKAPRGEIGLPRLPAELCFVTKRKSPFIGRSPKFFVGYLIRQRESIASKSWCHMPPRQPPITVDRGSSTIPLAK
jgi:hypothetical protein